MTFVTSFRRSDGGSRLPWFVARGSCLAGPLGKLHERRATVHVRRRAILPAVRIHNIILAIAWLLTICSASDERRSANHDLAGPAEAGHYEAALNPSIPAQENARVSPSLFGEMRWRSNRAAPRKPHSRGCGASEPSLHVLYGRV